jgi:hypothetical protein
MYVLVKNAESAGDETVVALFEHDDICVVAQT